MKKTASITADLLIKHQIERLQIERLRVSAGENITANRIAMLMTNVLNFYSELSALHTQALIEELANDVDSANA